MTNVRFFRNGVFTANPTPDHLRALGATSSSSAKAGDDLSAPFKIAEDPDVLGTDTLGVDTDRAVLGEITHNAARLSVQEPPPLVKATYLKDLLASRMLVVLSLPTCPQCDALAAYLEENGIENPRQYFTKWDKADEAVYKIRRAQLVEITCVDKFTYPQVFMNEEYCGGWKEFKMSIEDGESVSELEKIGWSPKPLFCMDEDDDF